jgi:hypothetical protein
MVSRVSASNIVGQLSSRRFCSATRDLDVPGLGVFTSDNIVFINMAMLVAGPMSDPTPLSATLGVTVLVSADESLRRVVALVGGGSTECGDGQRCRSARLATAVGNVLATRRGFARVSILTESCAGIIECVSVRALFSVRSLLRVHYRSLYLVTREMCHTGHHTNVMGALYDPTGNLP